MRKLPLILLLTSSLLADPKWGPFRDVKNANGLIGYHLGRDPSSMDLLFVDYYNHTSDDLNVTVNVVCGASEWVDSFPLDGGSFGGRNWHECSGEFIVTMIKNSRR